MSTSKKGGGMNDEARHLSSLMGDAKIGRRYREMSLRQFGDIGSTYIQRIQSGDIIEYCSTGGGFSVHGEESHAFSMVFLKAILLADCTVAHLSLAGLARAIDDWEFAERITDVDCLLITRFCNDVAEASPIDNYKRMQIEDLFLERWDDGRSLMVQSVQELTTYRGWWSKSFLAKLNEYNETLEIK